MKKAFNLVLAILMLLCAVPIQAYTEIPDHVKVYQTIDWNIDENGVLTIQDGITALPTFVSSWGVYGPWRGNGSITKVIIPDTVTHIGERLFENCVNLKEVVLPKSLETIGDDAFGGCNSVEKITISDENTNFKVVDDVLFDNNGQRLCWYPVGKPDKEYTIPEGTVEIKANAFENCIALEKVNFPSTLATIKPEAFAGGINLDNINLPDSVTYIGKGAFAGCVKLSNIKMPPYAYLHGNPFSNTAFYNNEANWEGDGLYINKHLIAVKDDVNEYTIKPDTISIAGEVFSDTTNLKSITIPGSVKCIGDRIFANNPGIEEIILEEGLEIIGNGAFNWSHIREITLPQSLKIIGGNAFADSWLKSIIIPDNVIDIGEGAFDGCGSLESVVLGKSLGNIGKDAFSMCYYLESITIPDSVRTIGSGAFYYNRKLNSVYIGSGLCEFERGFFNSCDALSIIEISEDNPYFSTKDNVVFDKSGETLIYYPAGKQDEQYIIPDGVKVISESALAHASFNTLTIPKSVTKIENYNHCNDLINIYYADTNEEWDRIEIAEYNTKIQEAMVHFADGTVSNVYKNLRFREEEDAVYVIGMLDDTAISVSIPGEINGKRVEIASGAFKNTNLVTVVLDERIKTIPYSAFYGCRKLESINLEYVERIDSQAFMYCESLKEVNLLNIKSWSGVTEGELNEEGTLMYFPYDIYLDRYEQFSIWTVFYGAEIGTLRIKWPEVNFDEDANCFPALFINSKVNKVIFENFTISPSPGEFKTTGYISTTKPRWQSSVDLTLENTEMVICGKDENTRLYAEKLGARFELIELPYEYSINNGYVIINKYTGNEERVVIPDEIEGLPVSVIRKGAFKECESIKEIIIPESVKSIDHEAFDNCSNVEKTTILNPYVYIAPLSWNYVYPENAPPYIPHGQKEPNHPAFNLGGKTYGYKNSTAKSTFSVNFVALEGEAPLPGLDVAENVAAFVEGTYFADETKAVITRGNDVLTIKAGEKTARISHVSYGGERDFELETVPEYKDGVYYVSMKDVLRAFDLI